MDDMERIEVDGLIIIKPRSKSKIPLDCPSCGFALSTREDVLCYKVYECCEECDHSYRRPNLVKWNLGWRPKKNSSTSITE